MGWLMLAMPLSAQLANSGSPIEGLSAESEAPMPLRENHFIVKYKRVAGETAQATDAKVASVNARHQTKSKKMLSRRLGIQLLETAKGEKPEVVLARLRKDPSVEYAEVDYAISLSAIPNDGEYLKQWGLHNIGQTVFDEGSGESRTGIVDRDVDAPEAWDIRNSAESVVVAVVDTGIRYTHQDLAGNMWKNTKEIPGNGVDDDGNGYVDDFYGVNCLVDPKSPNAGNCMGDHFHGTHCAGIIGAVANNGVGIAGVAWKVQLMAVKTFDSNGRSYVSDNIEGIEYARKMGAQAINCSWGGAGYSQALRDAIGACRDQGIIVVVAAGNSETNLDLRRSYPGDYMLENIVTVGSMNLKGQKSYFSNYGMGAVNLFAPGENIYSTGTASDSAYLFCSGSSMAAPHVTGTFALMKAQFPNESYQKLINRMLRGAVPSGYLDRYCQTGELNVLNALKSTDFRPINDDHNAPMNLGSVNGITTRVATGEATKESGEPAIAGQAGGHSVWFLWKAPATGVAYVNTKGSTFDTVLGLYKKGTASRPYQLIAANDNDPSGGVTSSVNFNAVKDTIYKIAVDGVGGVTGMALVTVGVPPANDSFANRMILSGDRFATTGTNAAATTEAGEPQFPGGGGIHSVWYSWTAPVSGDYIIDTNGSNFDTLLSIYTGGSLSALQLVAENDDIQDGVLRQSQLIVSLQGGVTYQIAVDGYGGEAGNINLSVYRIYGWNALNVGQIGDVSGVMNESTGSGTLSTMGGGYTNSSGGSGDDFYFNCRYIEGNFDMKVRVTSWKTVNTSSGIRTDNYGNVGLMARESALGLDKCVGVAIKSSARYLGSSWSGYMGGRMFHRSVWGADQQVANGKTFRPVDVEPQWLRLVREGNQFTSYLSVDGVTWKQVGETVTVDLSNKIFVGVATCGSGLVHYDDPDWTPAITNTFTTTVDGFSLTQ